MSEEKKPNVDIIADLIRRDLSNILTNSKAMSDKQALKINIVKNAIHKCKISFNKDAT